MVFEGSNNCFIFALKTIVSGPTELLSFNNSSNVLTCITGPKSPPIAQAFSLDGVLQLAANPSNPSKFILNFW